jgi:hypothetical protein
MKKLIFSFGLIAALASCGGKNEPVSGDETMVDTTICDSTMCDSMACDSIPCDSSVVDTTK